MARHNFTSKIVRALGNRAAQRCSNPGCRQTTSGPAEDPERSTNVGVAAHITAASPKGPRFDPSLTPEERGGPENGIWLCQRCAKLIDDDAERYPVGLLRGWKAAHEASVEVEVRTGSRDSGAALPLDALHVHHALQKSTGSAAGTVWVKASGRSYSWDLLGSICVSMSRRHLARLVAALRRLEDADLVEIEWKRAGEPQRFALSQPGWEHAALDLTENDVYWWTTLTE